MALMVLGLVGCPNLAQNQCTFEIGTCKHNFDHIMYTLLWVCVPYPLKIQDLPGERFFPIYLKVTPLLEHFCKNKGFTLKI